MIAIFPEDSGILSATFPITATWSPISITIGRRSSTTAPPSVWMKVVSSSSRRTSCRCVARRHLHPHRLHARPFERCIWLPVGARLRDTRQHRSEPLLCRGQALGDRRLDVDVREQRVDRLGCDLCADLGVFDHLPRDRLEALLVESGVLDVEGDHPHEREQDRHDGQHARGDDPHARRAFGFRGLFSFGHRAHRLSTI